MTHLMSVTESGNSYSRRWLSLTLKKKRKIKFMKVYNRKIFTMNGGDAMLDTQVYY